MTGVALMARSCLGKTVIGRLLTLLVVLGVAAAGLPHTACAGAAATTVPGKPAKSSKPAAAASQAAIRAVAAPERPPEAIQAPARVYLFRGALGPLFSTGMDRLADKIEQAGFDARVYEFTLCDLIALQVAKNYREAPGPIVLIGHSMGGLCSVRISIALQEQNIPVSLVVTVDPAHATKSVPLNVQRFINIFLSDNILGGGDVKPEPGFRGHYASFDMKDHDEVTHINIDKMDDVHAQLVTMISQLSQTPATAEADPVQLRYLVPPKVSLELWDSGTPLAVRPGETLDQIATNYRVPLWALQQSNRGLGSTPLIPGQRIILPRHLLPQAANQPAPQPPDAPVRR
ncbi:LysM peptidoglycan-binding domain-containing protein [Bradyrhizobium ontarionense]|uniref:LysM peptidoglycan-binding domain-containing protein n=1 Tax=Bradyrhizobium ontarionense TaxID=2898149 RepID=A0ABY3R9C2_9BRAD|nr:alpha/beta fold hydrolase [Bradyrhizobium sp. A19]UFZ03965.1 LysM peptidoglycan-binding domain-containing protein [Bradyrhizobium sp. A19]